MSRARAKRVLDCARDAGVSVAAAESVTGGLVAAALTAVPGASDSFVGSITAYDAAAKMQLLGVDATVIASAGVVSEAVAVAMAEGAVRAIGADVAVATTGVAGPAAHSGVDVGRVVVAAVGAGRSVVRVLDLRGNRSEVRSQAVDAALDTLCEVLDSSARPGTPLG